MGVEPTNSLDSRSSRFAKGLRTVPLVTLEGLEPSRPKASVFKTDVYCQFHHRVILSQPNLHSCICDFYSGRNSPNSVQGPLDVL